MDIDKEFHCRVDRYNFPSLMIDDSGIVEIRRLPTLNFYMSMDTTKLYTILDRNGVELTGHHSGRGRTFEEAKTLLYKLNKNGEFDPYKMREIGTVSDREHRKEYAIYYNLSGGKKFYIGIIVGSPKNLPIINGIQLLAEPIPNKPGQELGDVCNRDLGPPFHPECNGKCKEAELIGDPGSDICKDGCVWAHTGSSHFCTGIIKERNPENCNCHIGNCAPCSACMKDRRYCPECGWEGADE